MVCRGTYGAICGVGNYDGGVLEWGESCWADLWEVWVGEFGIGGWKWDGGFVAFGSWVLRYVYREWVLVVEVDVWRMR